MGTTDIFHIFVNLLSLPSLFHLSIHIHAVNNIEVFKTKYTRPILPSTTRSWSNFSCELLTDVLSGQLGSSLHISRVTSNRLHGFA